METEIKTINVEEGYKAAVVLMTTARRIAETLKPKFETRGGVDYNPFGGFTDSLENEIMKLREELIKITADKYKNLYMPNVKPDVDFKKLMDTEAGDQDFTEDVIQSWFENATKDKAALEHQSLGHLQHVASPLIPHRDEEGEWGKPKNPETLVKGHFLRLHAYTWDSQFKSISAYTMWEPLEALDKLISAAAGDYNVIDAEPMLNLCQHSNTRDPPEFYKKAEVSHPIVKSFRFYKNDSFEIEFKTPEQAEAVARLLLSPFSEEA